MFQKAKLCALVFMSIYMTDVHSVEEYELWWEQCLENKVPISTFEGWLGDMNAESRVAMRRHVMQMGYKSILDVPSGLCIDYFGFKQDGMPIAYQGVDITPKLVSLARKQQIPVIVGDIKKLPFQDNQFDVCYARHILEHLDSYEQALNSLIRVAKKEVFITFFIHPEETPVRRAYYDNDYLLYGHTYNKTELEKFIRSNKKVLNIEWEDVNKEEIILHIYLQ